MLRQFGQLTREKVARTVGPTLCTIQAATLKDRMHVPRAGVLLILTAAFVLLFVGLSGAPIARALPWPTPPPGPVGPLPTVIPGQQIITIAVPARVGAVTAVVDPIFPGPVPRIPPLAITTIRSAESDPQEQVQLDIEAGTIPITFQLMYEPVDSATLPATPPSWRILRSFRLGTFDYLGNPVDLGFARPLLLRIPVQGSHLREAGGDAANLLVARFDQETGRWIPLITSVEQDGSITVRLLHVGLLALIADLPPVAGPLGS